MGLITELKRRNVFRVGIAYAVLAWVVIQAADVIFPALQFPAWTISFVTVLTILGFPLAVFLAWAFELTPEGLKREHEVDRSRSITHSTGRKLDFAIIGLLAVALGFVVWDAYLSGSGPDSPVAGVPATATDPPPVAAAGTAGTSIAVLPFVNMSADPEQEYFGDGIAEEILNGLAQIEDLQVAARTSSFYFKGERVNLTTIGETLNVDHVLEGSVRKSGNQLRITAQLVKVDDGFHLWSEIYNRDASDIFAVQEEIARTVVETLQLEFGLGNDEKLVRQGTDNVEAYNWYLRGRYFVEQQSPESFPKAIEAYGKVTELDPGFAGGYGGLAYALSYNTTWFAAFTEDVAADIRAAYSRALEQDANQTDALLAKAMDRILTDFDYTAADALVRRALSRDRNKVLVMDFVWYAFLMPQKRFAEAKALLQELERQDPLSALVKQGIATMEMLLGHDEAAIAKFREALELNPADFFSYLFVADILIKLERFADADDAIREMENIVGEDFFFTRNVRSRWHFAQGNLAEATANLEGSISLYEAADGGLPWATWIGFNLIWLDRIDEGITWLEQASEKPEFFATTQHFFALRTPGVYENPRFQALLRKMNIDDESIDELKALGPL